MRKPGEIEIQHNVPFVPRRRSEIGRPRTYPFDKLTAVGDAFDVESPKQYISQDKALYAALWRARAELGWNFDWSRTPTGFRIHRLEGPAPEIKHRTKKGQAA